MGEITDVVVELNGSRIDLFSAPPWEVPGLSNRIKSVPGASWSATKRCWTYPANLATCRSLRAAFDDMLIIGPELTSWAREAVRAEAARAALTRATDAPCPELKAWYPTLHDQLRPSQRVGARYLSQRPSILGDQPGLGKTIQFLSSLIEGGRLEGTHLIAAPVVAKTQVWSVQVEKWLGMDATVANGSTGQRKQIIQDFFSQVREYGTDEYAHFLVINPEMLQVKIHLDDRGQPTGEETIKFPDLFAHEWTSITVDEAQKYLLGIKNMRRKTQAGEGLTRLRSQHRVALTGTPMKGDPRRLWSILHWLYPNQYRSYWQWIETYFFVTNNGFGREIGSLKPEMEKHFYSEIDSVMLRRTKAEVLKELPAKMYNDVWCEMNPVQAKQYKDMLHVSEAKFGDHHVSAVGVLSELIRCTQIATAAQVVSFSGDKPRPTSDSGKFETLIEMLEERGLTKSPEDRFGNDKFVVASQFTEVLDFLERHFTSMGFEVLKIHGGVSAKKRDIAQRDFQSEGGARIMLINTHTAQAIDLDAHCDEMFVLDETFVPDDQEQLEDRIHRASRIHQVTIHYLRTRGTIDEYRKTLVDDKENLQKLILDGRRGVDFAKKLMGG